MWDCTVTPTPVILRCKMLPLINTCGRLVERQTRDGLCDVHRLRGGNDGGGVGGGGAGGGLHGEMRRPK